MFIIRILVILVSQLYWYSLIIVHRPFLLLLISVIVLSRKAIGAGKVRSTRMPWDQQCPTRRVWGHLPDIVPLRINYCASVSPVSTCSVCASVSSCIYIFLSTYQSNVIAICVFFSSTTLRPMTITINHQHKWRRQRLKSTSHQYPM